MIGRRIKKPQSLRIGISAQMLPITIGYGSNLIATPFILARLGIHDFGLWALTGAVAQYGVLFDLGVSRAIARYVALHHEQKDEARERAAVGAGVAVLLTIGSLLTCVPLLFSPQLSRLLRIDDPNLTRALFLCSISVLISGLLGSMFTNASTGRGRIVAANIGITIQRAAVVIGGVIALITAPGLGSFAIGSALGGTFGLLVVLIAIWLDEREIRIGWPRKAVLADLISFGGKAQVIGAAEIVVLQSGKVMAGVVLGPAAAGVYEFGSRLALGAKAVASSASNVLSAHLTRQYARSGLAEIRRDYFRLVQRNAAVSICPLLLFTATSVSIIPAWLGVEDQRATWVLIVLTVAFSINASTGVTGAIAYALNQIGLLAIIASAEAVLSVVLASLFGLIAGFYGILVGIGLSIALSAIAGPVAIHRINRFPLSDYFRPLIGPFIVGGVSVLLAMPIGIITSPSDRASAVIPLLCGASVYGISYVTLGLRFGYLPNMNLFTKLGFLRSRR